VRDGVLRPLVPVEAIDRFGIALLLCRGCGRGRTWVPGEGGRSNDRPPRPVDCPG
jgi:hypothetical protein